MSDQGFSVTHKQWTDLQSELTTLRRALAEAEKDYRLIMAEKQAQLEDALKLRDTALAGERKANEKMIAHRRAYEANEQMFEDQISRLKAEVEAVKHCPKAHKYSECGWCRAEKAEAELAEAKKAGEEMAHLYSSACADLAEAKKRLKSGDVVAEAQLVNAAKEWKEMYDKAKAALEQSMDAGYAQGVENAEARALKRITALESALKRRDEALKRITFIVKARASYIWRAAVRPFKKGRLHLDLSMLPGVLIELIRESRMASVSLKEPYDP